MNVEDSNAVPEWIGTLPEDLQANSSLHKFKDTGGLAKSYMELEGKMGNSMRVPGADAGETAHKEFAEELRSKYNENSPFKLGYLPDESPESRVLYNQSRGIPTEATAYGDVEGLPEQTLERTKAMAFAGEMDSHQYGLVSAWLANEQSEVVEAQKTAETERMDAIREKLGESTDQRISRIESVARGKGIEISLEGAPASVVLYMDSLIDDIEGRGPQGNGVAAVEVGPTTNELQDRISERRKRLIEEPFMERGEYQRLQEANIRDMQVISNST